jgi:hypothetical protein
MGDGEYGGNGSVHWYGTHKKDRNHGMGQNPHSYHEVDEYPSAPGDDFEVQVLNLTAGDAYTVDASGVLTVHTPIVINPANPKEYTRSIYITWPDPPSASGGSPAHTAKGLSAKKKKVAGGKKKKAAAAKKKR